MLENILLHIFLETIDFLNIIKQFIKTMKTHGAGLSSFILIKAELQQAQLPPKIFFWDEDFEESLRVFCIRLSIGH